MQIVKGNKRLETNKTLPIVKYVNNFFNNSYFSSINLGYTPNHNYQGVI